MAEEMGDKMQLFEILHFNVMGIFIICYILTFSNTYRLFHFVHTVPLQRWLLSFLIYKYWNQGSWSDSLRVTQLVSGQATIQNQMILLKISHCWKISSNWEAKAKKEPGPAWLSWNRKFGNISENVRVGSSKGLSLHRNTDKLSKNS